MKPVNSNIFQLSCATSDIIFILLVQVEEYHLKEVMHRSL